jgi:tetratricopeptide (TPR) repeat protein
MPSKGKGVAAVPPLTSQELNNMAPDELAKLAYGRMGSGDLEGALAALSAPQALNAQDNEALRAAFYELRLQRAIATARARNCQDVGDQLARISAPEAKFAYTHPGGTDYLESPRTLFYVGRTYGLCSNPREALAAWKRVANKKVDSNSAEAVFPVLARIQLSAYDGKPAVPMLQKALDETKEHLKSAPPDGKAAAHYQNGLLLQALGKLGDSDDQFEQAAKGPEMIRCWAHIGLRDNDLGRQGIR